MAEYALTTASSSRLYTHIMKIYKFVLLGLTSVSIKEGKTVKKMMALNRGKNILLCYIMRKIFRQVVQF